MQKKKRSFSGTLAFIIALLVLAVFVPINLIVNYNDQSYDLTPSGKYTLDPVTVKLLDDASDKHIDVYFLEDMLNLRSIPKYLPLYHTLTQLEERDNVTLTCFDPNENVELANELDPNGNLGLSVADIVIKCGDTVKRIPFIRCFPTDEEGILAYAGEELIAGALSICTAGQLPTVYFITGLNDTDPMTEYSKYIDEIKSDSYDVQPLDGETQDIPDNAAIVYLCAPNKDISDNLRNKLSVYIDNGGAVSMILPPCETPGRFTNLEYLLEKFELTMDYNIIKEKNSQYQLQNLDSEQDPLFFRVTYPAAGEDNTEDLTTDINTLISNGTYVAGISNARSFSEISSDTAMIEKYPVIENLPNADPSTSMEFQYTAESIGFGGDSSTAQAAEEKTDNFLAMGYYSFNKQTGSKLWVIGSDDVISDERVTLFTYGTREMTLFSNTWLYDSDVDMGIGTKSNSYDYMHFENGEQAEKTLRIFTIVPIIIALCGVAVWLKRRYA